MQYVHMCKPLSTPSCDYDSNCLVTLTIVGLVRWTMSLNLRSVSLSRENREGLGYQTTISSSDQGDLGDCVQRREVYCRVGKRPIQCSCSPEQWVITLETIGINALGSIPRRHCVLEYAGASGYSRLFEISIENISLSGYLCSYRVS